MHNIIIIILLLIIIKIYDALCAHSRGRGDKHINGHFLLVTKRPIAHSGRFVWIRNCVGEFGTDTGQPLMTSNVMSNHLSDHHMAYYTYMKMQIKIL